MSLDVGIHVRNLFTPQFTHLPSAQVYIATSVTTAPIVSARVTKDNVAGVYLIQGVEDFTVSLEEVERSWNLPLERVVVSPWLQERLAQVGLSSHLIENGVDTNLFSPVGDGDGWGVLAMVSEQVNKRSDLVVDVFNRLAESRPDLPLRTFGACAVPQGMPPSVRHLQNPGRSDLAEMYRSSAVYVCASDSEGFGLPVLEAMASGCAVVTTDNGGVPAFAGDAVYVAPRGDSDAIFDGVVRLVSGAEERQEYVRRGLKKAHRMSSTGSSQRFERVVCSLLR
ncbi:glycosyltransferase family 4 protein [Terrabacter sp. 2TAF16]|uniref:glycosyltransferase family 4 protein n=1 Tax=Terrabacter sp. 2TAF16 TaxID=3233008 RepID=UPI003F9E5ACB